MRKVVFANAPETSAWKYLKALMHVYGAKTMGLAWCKSERAAFEAMCPPWALT